MENSNEKTPNRNALPGVMMLLLGDPDGLKLSILKAGAGQGKVHVTPSGSMYPSGTVVTLTAEANLGSSFNGWSGACSRKLLTCKVTMNKDKRVTANFGIESQVPRANQANLGPLAGAAIHVYSLKNLSSPIKGPFQTNNSAHRKKLSFDYKQLLSSKSFVSLVHTGADRDIFEKALDSVFGVHFQDS